TTVFDDSAEDDRLRLIFTCCSPALALEAQVALTLRTLCGLGTAEIARACVPDMTDDLKVKVLPGPGRRNRSEAQGRDREGASEGSAERNREPTYRNRIRGAADQGELARDSEAPAANETRRKSGGCAVKAGSLTQGDLASCLKGRRHRMAEREVSRG